MVKSRAKLSGSPFLYSGLEITDVRKNDRHAELSDEFVGTNGEYYVRI